MIILKKSQFVIHDTVRDNCSVSNHSSTVVVDVNAPLILFSVVLLHLFEFAQVTSNGFFQKLLQSEDKTVKEA